MKNDVFKLLETFRKTKKYYEIGKLNFKGVSGYDVYNPTAPFKVNDQKIIIARVEKRDEEKSMAMFFKENKKDEFELLKDYPFYFLQDPFITIIDKNYVFGGTELIGIDQKTYQYRVAFYKGKKINHLKRFFTGPTGMKDIRLIELKDKKVGVFSRPQGVIGGRGKIGFTVIDNLNKLTKEVILEAPLLDLLPDENWCGVNELHLLKDGKIGVLAHVAAFSKKTIRHYYPATFILDPLTKAHTPIKIIAERKDFLDGPYKRKDLIDVLFSAGLILMDEKAKLYTGVSDCEIQYAVIDNPFL